MGRVVEMPKPAATVTRSTGNIPELEELPTLAAERIAIHHRLREWFAVKREWKSLAEAAKLHPSTVSRAAYYVSNRTTRGTIHKLAPHLGIKLSATMLRGWRP